MLLQISLTPALQGAVQGRLTTYIFIGQLLARERLLCIVWPRPPEESIEGTPSLVPRAHYVHQTLVIRDTDFVPNPL
jgi:hypothetical protein